MLVAPELMMHVGPPPQEVLDQLWLWKLLMAGFTLVFILQVVALDVAGALLTGLLLGFGWIMLRDGMTEMAKYALIYAVLCGLNFFFEVLPLISEISGRVTRRAELATPTIEVNGTRVTTYTLATQTHPFFDPPLGLAYNAPSSGAQASSRALQAKVAAKGAPNVPTKVAAKGSTAVGRDAPRGATLQATAEMPSEGVNKAAAKSSSPAPAPIPRLTHDERRRRWALTGSAVASMLHEMLEFEFVCGKGWMEGMQRLVENTPRDHIGRRYGLDDFAGPLLRDHFIQWTSSHSRAENFRKVILRLEMKVVVATKHLDLSYDWTLRPGAFQESTAKMARQLGATENPPFDGFMHMKRGLLFVGLPLRLYLADSPHLYELIRRMRSLADPAIAGEVVSVSNVRKVLDADGFWACSK
ncbi:unnamed protein product [Symbiodinium sp. CCMP2592]|nr:unnamed protein product [Symbiodinium sp. CCMP2592]